MMVDIGGYIGRLVGIISLKRHTFSLSFTTDIGVPNMALGPPMLTGAIHKGPPFHCHALISPVGYSCAKT